MSQQRRTCDTGQPWFVTPAVATHRPGRPAHRDAVRVAQLPDKPPVPVAQAAPALSEDPPVIVPNPVARPRPRLVNWPLVGGVGALVWIWLVGVILVGWLASSPSAEAEAAPLVALVEHAPAPIPRIVAPAQPPAAAAISIQPVREEPAPVAVVEPKPKPEPKPEPVVEKPAPAAKEEVGKYGTAIDFMDDPIEAADVAIKNRKILLVLHVSGDFEDPGCT